MAFLRGKLLTRMYLMFTGPAGPNEFFLTGPKPFLGIFAVLGLAVHCQGRALDTLNQFIEGSHLSTMEIKESIKM